MKEMIKISGAYHSKFGKHQGRSIYDLYKEALTGIIENTGISPKAVDGVFVGNYSGGSFNKQENIAPFGVNIFPELQYKPFYRVETACTSGSSAIHMAAAHIKAGLMDRAIVIGLEKMTDNSTKDITKSLAMATYWPEEGEKGVNAPCMFADLANGYIRKYDIPQNQLRSQLAEIAAKNYHNGSLNKNAHLQKPISSTDILSLPEEKNPIIQSPLRLHDCSLISDGAAAIMLEKSENNEGVILKSFYNASDFLDSFGKNKSDHFLNGAQEAINKTLKESILTIADIDLAEVHDCFTITELLIYSALGIAEPGKEFEAIEKGKVFRNGELPINLSGGLKAKGHPIGATGVSMHAYIYQQLMGELEDNQLENLKRGITVNIGGSGTSNCVSVIEKL